MKISQLTVENIRGINLAVLDNLGDVVAIAGANGCGKSCLLDCVRLFKSQYGSYNQDESHLWWQEKSLNVGDRTSAIQVLRQKNRNGNIVASIKLEGTEKDFILADSPRLVERLALQELFPGLRAPLTLWNWRGIPEFAPHRNSIIAKTEEMNADIRREIAGDTIQGRVTIYTNGSLSIDPNRALTYIFSTFEPDDLGVIDFHAADRNYAYEHVTNVNINVAAKDEQWKNTAMYNLAQKYGNVKTALATDYIISVLASKAGAGIDAEAELTTTLQSIFAELIPGKVFKGPIPTAAGQLEFPVSTDGAVHDLNELSSGEKEVVFGYLRTRARAARNSVILIDEPELHLNPGMVQGLPTLYQKHIGSALNNQIWLVTHSDVFLRSAFNDSDMQLFHMAVASKQPNTNQISSISKESEFDRTCIDLIGDIANYRPGQPVLVVEGQQQFDILVLQRLFAQELRGVNVLEAGGKDQVRQRHAALREAAVQDGSRKTILSITDSDAGPSTDESNGQYQWPAYHIENYLLEPKYIALAIDSLQARRPGTTTLRYVQGALRRSKDEAASDLGQRDFFRRMKSRLNRHIGKIGAPDQDLSVESIQAHLKRCKNALNSDLAEIAGEERLNRELEEQNAATAKLQASDDVPSTLPGRAVLTKVADEVMPKGDYITLRNAVLNEMARDGFQPPEMKAVLARCLAHE